MTSHNEAIMQLLLANQGATSLFLEDIIREVDIGIHDYEIGVLQRVRFDIYAMIGGAIPTKSDEIDGTHRRDQRCAAQSSQLI